MNYVFLLLFGDKFFKHNIHQIIENIISHFRTIIFYKQIIQRNSALISLSVETVENQLWNFLD